MTGPGTGPRSGGQACMRWSPGRMQTWRRPADGGFDASRYTVEAIAEAPARRFVTARHYAGGSWPAASLRYGLFDQAAGGELAGAAVLGIPASSRVLTGVFPGLEPYRESLELSRFVLSAQVPSNGETWFLARAFALASRRGIRGVVSFADPVPPPAGGRHPGQARSYRPDLRRLGAVYTGRGTRRTLKLLRNGTVVSDRALQKVRRREPGHEYVERLLISHGARPPRAAENAAR